MNKMHAYIIVDNLHTTVTQCVSITWGCIRLEKHGCFLSEALVIGCIWYCIYLKEAEPHK